MPIDFNPLGQQLGAIPPDGEQIFPNNWAFANPADAVELQDIAIGVTKVKKVPMPNSKLPPLELNLPAKEHSPWENIASVADFYIARSEGRYMEYRVHDEFHEPVSPIKIYSEMSLKKLILTNSLRVHKVNKVFVFAPVRWLNGLVGVWTGCSRDQYADAIKAKKIKEHGLLSWTLVNVAEGEH